MPPFQALKHGVTQAELTEQLTTQTFQGSLRVLCIRQATIKACLASTHMG